MMQLRQAIQQYVALRRALGFQVRRLAENLPKFATFMEEKCAPHITTELAVEWATQPTDHKPSDWAQRLGFVRVFARHWHATDPRTEIPPIGLLPFRPQRARPYLYSESEIQDLLAAALKLRPRQGLRSWTYHCLFGLLAVTGCGSVKRSNSSEQMWISATAFSPSAGRSSARPVWFRCTLLRGTPWLITLDVAIGSWAACLHPVFCSTIMAVVWKSQPCTERSIAYRGKSACGDPKITKGRGSMTFATDSLSVLSFTGTGQMRILSGGCRFYQPSWAMAMWQTPTGTSRWNRN